MKLGLLLARTGPSGLWSIGCEAAVMAAVAELNAAGGVCGREITLAIGDSGATPQSAERGAARLLRRDGIDALIGLQPSHMRQAVRRGLAGAAPYIYTPQYEGGYAGPCTLAIGLSDAETLGPALAWLAERRRVTRSYFVGNDYVWPRVAHGSALDAMAASGVREVGSALLPFGAQDYGAIFAAIRRARPHLVVTVLLGEECVRFHRAFAAAGLAARTLRLALAVDETVLLGLGAEATENLYTAATYFDGAAGGGEARACEIYETAFGRDRPPLNVFSLGCYDAVRVAAGLARRTGAVDAASLARAVGRGARGAVARALAAPETEGRATLRLAEADGVAFRLRATYPARDSA